MTRCHDRSFGFQLDTSNGSKRLIANGGYYANPAPHIDFHISRRPCPGISPCHGESRVICHYSGRVDSYCSYFVPVSVGVPDEEAPCVRPRPGREPDRRFPFNLYQSAAPEAERNKRDT